MKSLKEISTLVKVCSAMVKEVNDAEQLKKAKADVKEDLKNLKELKDKSSIKKLATTVVNRHKIGAGLTKDMFYSEEAEFIKTAVKESEPVKKVTAKVDVVSAMIPDKAKIEALNYKHWCINWFSISKMGLTDPLAVVGGMLKYTWIFDLMKANTMARSYVEGRSGNNVEQIQRQTSYMINSMCNMILNALQHPDTVVLTQAYMLPKEILIAMDLENMVAELPGTVLAKVDQFAGARYLDTAEGCGIGSDACGLPKMTSGVALMNEMPQASCIVSSNLPCDGGFSSYETIQETQGGIPIYRMSAPYNFRDDESVLTFKEDLKGLIKFLEAETGHKMNYDKLKEACEYYNEMVDYEIERWEMAKLDPPVLSSEAIALPHLWSFNCISGLKDTTRHHKKLLDIAKKAMEKGGVASPVIRYRTCFWNPAPACYGHVLGWIERCWGVGSMMDLDTYGDMNYVDVSTPDTMLEGLAKRYMWATMSRHTRGPAENMLGDLMTVVKDYKVDFVLYPAHIGCKNSMSLESQMKDMCKEVGVPFCIFRYEFLDSRVTSRQAIRDQVNKFMTEVMHAEPLDPSLLNIDDGKDEDW